MNLRLPLKLNLSLEQQLLLQVVRQLVMGRILSSLGGIPWQRWQRQYSAMTVALEVSSGRSDDVLVG